MITVDMKKYEAFCKEACIKAGLCEESAEATEEPSEENAEATEAPAEEGSEATGEETNTEEETQPSEENPETGEDEG